jgi:hypothetical protein
MWPAFHTRQVAEETSVQGLRVAAESTTVMASKKKILMANSRRERRSIRVILTREDAKRILEISNINNAMSLLHGTRAAAKETLTVSTSLNKLEATSYPKRCTNRKFLVARQENMGFTAR